MKTKKIGNYCSDWFDLQELEINIDLIRLSMYKWMGIAFKNYVEKGVEDCPLCGKYNHFISCGSCPIHKDTSMTGCAGTPYDEWMEEKTDVYVDPEKIKQLALKELQYLCQIYYISIKERNRLSKVLGERNDTL